ncbi:MAG TPA: ATP-binding protein [Alphaproteobacteria bacterium]|nr:ATP-binding protein [Alphaproteobacteria bacterium]
MTSSPSPTEASSAAPARGADQRAQVAEGGRWGHRARRSVVLLLGIAISLAMSATSDRMLRHEAAIQDSLTRQTLTGGLQTYLDRELSLLAALRGLFESSEFVTADEFRRFAQQYENIRNRSPWMRVAWAERLPAAASGAAPQDAIAEMMAGRFVIRYREPDDLGDRLAAFDIAANPASLLAMRQATATGQPALSTPFQSDLLGEESKIVLAFAPAFQDVTGERQGHLIGFVVGVYAVDGLIGSYLDRSVPTGGLALRVSDGDATIFSRGEDVPGAEALPLRLGDQTWRIALSAAGTPLQSTIWVPLLVLLFGLSLTTLLYLHLLRIDGEYGRISAEVRAATGELAAANQALAERSSALQSLADDLRRTSTEAQLANSAKTMFLANMSHELRTPLNAMIGFSEIISRQMFGNEAERYTSYARDIHASGLHLLGIIEDLLDMSRIELGKLELRLAPAKPAAVVDDVVRLLQHRAREQGVKIACEGLDGLPEMQVDARALRQAFINLIGNAIKFSRAGTTVTIAGGRAANGDIAIAVRDQGIGIEEAALARVFDPFWQADAMRRQSQGGVGLGLAITRRLIEAHGGSVAAQSKRNEGTVMTILLPQSRILRQDDLPKAAAG